MANEWFCPDCRTATAGERDEPTVCTHCGFDRRCVAQDAADLGQAQRTIAVLHTLLTKAVPAIETVITQCHYDPCTRCDDYRRLLKEIEELPVAEVRFGEKPGVVAHATNAQGSMVIERLSYHVEPKPDPGQAFRSRVFTEPNLVDMATTIYANGRALTKALGFETNPATIYATCIAALQHLYLQQKAKSRDGDS